MSRRFLIEFGFVAASIAAAMLIRAFVAGLYFIPSESMLPTLIPGDIVLVSKWRTRLLGDLPRRGDVVVFRAPPSGAEIYVKRVIGLPGDTIGSRDGLLSINGRPIGRVVIADMTVPVSPTTPCQFEPLSRIAAIRLPDGRPACLYPAYRETLASGRGYDTLDLGTTIGDDFGPVRVPAGRLFLMGDNRDRSADSRFPAKEGGAIGLVPVGNLIGEPARILLSNDGGAHWSELRSWWRSVRWSRIGIGL